MAEKTLSDFIAKGNKDKKFEERAEEFEGRLKLMSEELGVEPTAIFQSTPNVLAAVIMLKDLWNKDSSTAQ